MRIFIVLYLTATHFIQTSRTLQCYSCSGGKECGVSFLPNSTHVKIVKSTKNEPLPSCMISVTPEGLITRGLVPAHLCRSSSHQFCCNEDLCNTLPSPPLPAFTALKCDIGKCTMTNGVCIYDDDYVTTLSSPTESCSVKLGQENYKYYKKGCNPTIRDAHVNQLASRSTQSDVYCCNSPECNTGQTSSPTRGVAIHCYTCDSRITGLDGCMVFNESSLHVYKAGSSRPDEECATIVGLSGRDIVTGTEYPAFAIRTFIPNCVSYQLGRVSYGGIYFQGRIECCSSNFCNTQTLDVKQPARKLPMIIAIIIIAILILIAIVSAVAFVIYRYCKKKDEERYGPVSTKEQEFPLNSLKNKLNDKPVQQPTPHGYPEESATP